jgi:formate C-acetyltransferase
MAALTKADFNDVGMFDFALPFTVSGAEQVCGALADYIHTCLSLKIPVLQPNVVDVKIMQEERDQKGTHPDLVVRVCGYSALFGQLPTDTQDEIIRRAIG